MNEFEVEGKCPKCGGQLGDNFDYPRCLECSKKFRRETTFSGYIRYEGGVDPTFYPAEPSATVKWARGVYGRLGKPMSVFDTRGAIDELLAAAPVEVRETPQSGEEVKDD